MRFTRILGLLLVIAFPCAAQEISMETSNKPAPYVTYIAEPVSVPAGHSAPVELRFHIRPGYHINSHTPKSEFLIPTMFSLEGGRDVVVGAVVYPRGVDFSFSFDPKEKLDVYASDFTLATKITAKAGQHILKGTLHYQACNHAACFPPKSLPVEIVVNAK